MVRRMLSRGRNETAAIHFDRVLDPEELLKGE
jgi:hypothetical protein